MKERFIPGVLAGAIAIGGIGVMAEGRGGETQSEIDARQDAEIMATYRTAVDADRTATMLFIALTKNPGSAYTLEEYKMLFDYMVELVQEGEDPLAPGFRQDAGLTEPLPTATPTTIYEGGE